jgi:hypothetical protein
MIIKKVLTESHKIESHTFYLCSCCLWVPTTNFQPFYIKKLSSSWYTKIMSFKIFKHSTAITFYRINADTFNLQNFSSFIKSFKNLYHKLGVVFLKFSTYPQTPFGGKGWKFEYIKNFLFWSYKHYQNIICLSVLIKVNKEVGLLRHTVSIN